MGYKCDLQICHKIKGEMFSATGETLSLRCCRLVPKSVGHTVCYRNYRPRQRSGPETSITPVQNKLSAINTYIHTYIHVNILHV